MSVLVMVFVCSQRNTGGARSSSTKRRRAVVGALGADERGDGLGDVSGQVGECDGKRHALVIIGVRDIRG